MPTPRRPKLVSASNARQQYSGLLMEIFEIMISSGLSRSDVAKITSSALASVKPASPRSMKDAPGYLSNAALVLDAWHRDRRYLNASASPKAISLLGRAPSVEALIRAECSSCTPKTLIGKLIAEGLIVANGNRYKPAGSIALLNAFDPLAIQHLSKSLATMIATVRSNLTPQNAAHRLIERFAEVPDLPVEHIKAFRVFTQRQGKVLLRTVNDWLESRRIRSRQLVPSGTVRAGIHVYSYLGRMKQHTSTPGYGVNS